MCGREAAGGELIPVGRLKGNDKGAALDSDLDSEEGKQQVINGVHLIPSA